MINRRAERSDPLSWQATESALIVCDVWNEHWSRGATERVDLLAPKINTFARRLRDEGVQIIHSPTHTMSYYEGNPARVRIRETSLLEVPGPVIFYNEPLDPPFPIDDSDGGSDTGEVEPRKFQRVWISQHPAIYIDQSADVISDSGMEIQSFLRLTGRERAFIVGVHANMCILKRQFGIRQMKAWGFNMALVEDLTDAMYNPKMPPYVSHEEGTRLVVEYIRENWCAVVNSENVFPPLLKPPPGGNDPKQFYFLS